MDKAIETTERIVEVTDRNPRRRKEELQRWIKYSKRRKEKPKRRIKYPNRLDARPQEALLCAKAKRQRQMFYLCESEASATKRIARSGNQSPQIN